jgi:hypothetical protein
LLPFSHSIFFLFLVSRRIFLRFELAGARIYRPRVWIWGARGPRAPNPGSIRSGTAADLAGEERPVGGGNPRWITSSGASSSSARRLGADPSGSSFSVSSFPGHLISPRRKRCFLLGALGSKGADFAVLCCSCECADRRGGRRQIGIGFRLSSMFFMRVRALGVSN